MALLSVLLLTSAHFHSRPTTLFVQRLVPCEGAMRRLLRSRVYRWPHRSQPSGFVEQHECSKRNRLAQLMIATKGRQDRESEVFRHSDLNSVTGSIRAARSAGKYPA